MEKNEITTINKALNKVLDNPKYSWIINTDILLSRDDLKQELLILYIGYKYKLDTSREAHLITFFSSRLMDLKRNYDRTHNFERGELSADLAFVDSDSLRGIVKDSINSLNCVGTISKRETDILFSYYVYGETFEDIAKTFGYADKAVAYNAVMRLVKKLSRDLEELLDIIEGVDMC